MKNQSHDHVLVIPFTSVSYPSGELHKEPADSERKDLVTHWMNKLSEKTCSYVQGIRQHGYTKFDGLYLLSKITVRSEPKTFKTVRRNQTGPVKRPFSQLFYLKQVEKQLKASRCYLSTTAGLIAGILFISTQRVAFHSERLKLRTPEGQLARVPYTVLIPPRRGETTMPSECAYKPDQKYVQIATMDDFEFWLRGFVSYLKSFSYLKHSISESRCTDEL